MASYDAIVDEIPPRRESPMSTVGRKRGLYATNWVVPDNVGLCTPAKLTFHFSCALQRKILMDHTSSCLNVHMAEHVRFRRATSDMASDGIHECIICWNSPLHNVEHSEQPNSGGSILACTTSVSFARRAARCGLTGSSKRNRHLLFTWLLCGPASARTRLSNGKHAGTSIEEEDYTQLVICI